MTYRRQNRGALTTLGTLTSQALEVWESELQHRLLREQAQRRDTTLGSTIRRVSQFGMERSVPTLALPKATRRFRRSYLTARQTFSLQSICSKASGASHTPVML